MGRTNVIIADLRHFSELENQWKLLIFKALVGCWFAAQHGHNTGLEGRIQRTGYDH